MTNDEIIKRLAQVADDNVDLYSMGEELQELAKAAREISPPEPVSLRTIYLDLNWPDQLAVVPLRERGDVVECWVGAPALADGLTLRDLETCAYVTKTKRFILANCSKRPGLDEIPF